MINTFFISFYDICAAKQLWRHSIGPEQKDPAWRDGRYCGATRTNSELMCCFSFTSLVGISTYLNYFQNFQRIELQHARMYSATSQMNALCIFLQRCANLAFAKCWQEQYWSPIYRIYSHWSLQTLLAELSAISQMLLMLNSLLAIWFISENEEAGRVRWLWLSNWKTIHSRTLLCLLVERKSGMKLWSQNRRCFQIFQFVCELYARYRNLLCSHLLFDLTSLVNVHETQTGHFLAVLICELQVFCEALCQVTGCGNHSRICSCQIGPWLTAAMAAMGILWTLSLSLPC